LITFNGPNVEEWARAQGIPFARLADLFSEPRTQELIRAEIAHRNRELASFETIEEFRVVEELTIENGLLAPTMKVKRSLAMERYADLIQEMSRGD
jgi:long-chain acyl-CoA synthetase